MLPAVQKFLGRVFAHREQECPSAKGSVSREVNKTRKQEFSGPRSPSREQFYPLFGQLLASLVQSRL
jgi:hypothetical protein